MSALKPCPFCGGQASFTPTCYIDVVQCRVCGAQGMATMGQHEAAIVAWNRRVTPPATVAALVEALEECVGALELEGIHGGPTRQARAALAAYREAARQAAMDRAVADQPPPVTNEVYDLEREGV